MRIYVRLPTALRVTASEARGEMELDVPEGSTIQDVLTSLQITRRLPVAVNNGVIERDRERILEEGDKVELFVLIGGG